MAPPRYKIILSDLHLGFGPRLPDGSRNLLEEFHFDRPFCELLRYYSQGEYAAADVELILNGDILNHLHTTPEEPDCDRLTERIALTRTEKILAGHPEFFEALAEFARQPRRSVVYIMGNHDMGVAWPKVQQLLQAKISPGLKFHLDFYETDGVHVEHGNNCVADNRVDLDKLFLTKGEREPVLKMPWGSLFAIYLLNPLKRERPYIGKVFPFQMYLNWALFHDTRFALKTLARLILYFFRINFGRGLGRNFTFRETWKILREFSFPLSLDRQAQKILRERKEIRLVSFGHTHHPRYRRLGPAQEYINTGSWNELIGLDVGSLGRQLRLTFAEVCLQSDVGFVAKLKEWKGSHRDWEEVI